MFLYPEKIESTLHVTQIKNWVLDYCLSSLGRERIAAQATYANAIELERELRKVNEFKNLLMLGIPFPSDGYHDLKEDLKYVHIENYVLDAEQFIRIKSSVIAIDQIHQFFKSRQDKNEFPQIEAIIKMAFFDKKIIAIIQQVFDEKSEIKSSASKELQEIRSLKQSKYHQIERAYKSALQELSAKGYLTDSEETVRNGRRVFSVHAEYKRSFSGIIHDLSDTGKTVFMEPEQVVHYNNQLAEIEREEAHEIRKILKKLTDEIKVYKPLLEQYVEIFAQYDALRAKAKLAVAMQANMPRISNQPVIRLTKAYHPILKVQNNLASKKTIPFTIDMQPGKPVLMISGPNAGGKSVTMNAIGLLHWMVQFGLLIPAEEQSELYMFHQLFADVGDAQSIEDELSTYSSKLKFMKYFIEHADEKTLILIDEFGSGTDPLFGGAIAQTVLNQLIDKKSFCVITTHFGNLKTFSAQHPQIMNACMLFDEAQLSPTYQLSTGKPGSSYTFEIASKSGFNADFIQQAKALANTQQVQYDRLLNQLEQREVSLNKEIDSLKMEQKNLQEQIKKWKRLNEDLDINRKRIQYERLTERNSIEHEKKKHLQEFIAEIKNKKKEELLLETKREIEAKASEQSQNLKSLYRKMHPKESALPIGVGDKVKYIETNAIGIVEEVKRNKATVLFGNIRSVIPMEDLIQDVSKDNQIGLNKRKMDLKDREQISNELDLRGMFQQEAMQELEQYIDRALLNNVWQFKIIHGTGVLKKAVWNALRNFKQLDKYYHPSKDSGGEGATVVQV